MLLVLKLLTGNCECKRCSEYCKDITNFFGKLIWQSLLKIKRYTSHLPRNVIFNIYGVRWPRNYL